MNGLFDALETLTEKEKESVARFVEITMDELTYPEDGKLPSPDNTRGVLTLAFATVYVAGKKGVFG